MRAVQLLFPPDPGALRLLAALRATLAGVLTFLLVLLLGTIADLAVKDRILGFGVALFIAASVRDSTPRQRLITIVLAPLFAFVAIAVAALLFDQPVAAAALLPVIMFVVTYGATRGPRWSSLGIVTLIAYFMGLVTRDPPATLPMRLAVLALAAGDAALIRCLLLPERPRAELERLRRAIHGGIVRVLDRIAAAVAAGKWNRAAREALHQDVYRLAEVVMMAQARVAALAGGHDWTHLLAIELAVERVARVAVQDLGPPADRDSLLAALTALRRDAELPATRSSAGLAGALALLAHVMRDPPAQGPAPAPAPPPASAVPGLRSAVQTAAATALAIVAGDAVSPNRWYWAAFAAFVMFQGTRSRGESIIKGTQFIIGTLAGVIFGVLLATLLSGHEIPTMVAIVAAVFLAFQANVAAYGAMVFWITVILGLLFGMLGYFPPELLLLRLKESAVGAACGALVASLTLARRAHSSVEDATRAFLQALRRSVDGAAHALLDGTAPPDLPACILATEQRFHDLSAIARSEELGLAAARNEPLRRRILVLEGCEVWARELGQIGLQTAKLEDPELVSLVRDAARRIDDALRALIDRVTPGSTAIEVRRDDLPQGVRLLLRIHAALLHIALR